MEGLLLFRHVLPVLQLKSRCWGETQSGNANGLKGRLPYLKVDQVGLIYDKDFLAFIYQCRVLKLLLPNSCLVAVRELACI